MINLIMLTFRLNETFRIVGYPLLSHNGNLNLLNWVRVVMTKKIFLGVLMRICPTKFTLSIMEKFGGTR